MHKNYRFPNPIKLRTLDIIFHYQKTKLHAAIYNKDLVIDFNISRSDASNRLTKLRRWGLMKYNKGSRGYDGYLLTDRGKDFKDLTNDKTA